MRDDGGTRAILTAMTADPRAADHPDETDWSRLIATIATIIVLASVIRAIRGRVHDGRSAKQARAARPGRKQKRKGSNKVGTKVDTKKDTKGGAQRRRKHGRAARGERRRPAKVRWMSSHAAAK